MTNGEELFFDTDCLSAFMWVGETNILQELYGGRIVIPEPVYQEMSNPSVPHLKRQADMLIEKEVASVMAINAGTEEYKLYSDLIKLEKGKKAIGRGEASGIALAKKYQGVLASNNFRDVEPYVKEFDLKHISVGDILIKALEKELITENIGNVIWSKMLQRKRKLPTQSFSEYLECSQKL